MVWHPLISQFIACVNSETENVECVDLNPSGDSDLWVVA